MNSPAEIFKNSLAKTVAVANRARRMVGCTVTFDAEYKTPVGRLEKTRAAERYLSLITVGELFFGIFRSKQAERNLNRYRRFSARMKLLPFTPAVAEQFGAVKAHLARRGEMVADLDLWIVAHALVHGATVVTNNERDFGRIQRLRLENWTK
jgi:tRNA(fMet)-specific endonuclease VapC